MSKISGKINLQALKHVDMEMDGESGKVLGIFIPIKANNLFKGEKGIYLDLVAFDLKEVKDDQSHLVKQSLPKAVYEKMSDDEKKDTPIIGSLNTNWGGSGAAANNNADAGKTHDAKSKVPF